MSRVLFASLPSIQKNGPILSFYGELAKQVQGRVEDTKALDAIAAASHSVFVVFLCLVLGFQFFFTVFFPGVFCDCRLCMSLLMTPMIIP